MMMMRQVPPTAYKNYIRMRKIHQSSGMGLGGYRLGAVFLAIRAMLWLLGVHREFIGFTIYLDSVGTIIYAPGGNVDELGDHRFGLRLWFKDWP